MSGDIFQIGASGLEAASIGIAVTGQNIANQRVPGYSQEVSQQGSTLEQGFSFGYVGTGTQVITIQRQFDRLIAQQVNSTQSAASQYSSYLNQITPINNLIANPVAGLSPVLQSFFASLQNLSANPAASPSQQTALSGAQSLVAQFQSLQAQLSQSAVSVNGQITNEVNTINSYAQQLAAVNVAIQAGYSAANNQPPNQLLDQRDQLIANLSKETNVTITQQGNQYNVFIGNGQPLVMGANAYSLQTVPSTTNPNNVEVAYSTNGSLQPVSEASLIGGNLAGLFAYRTNSLSPIQNAIGQMAIVLGSAMNAQNQLGQTTNGAMGGPLFTIASPVVYPTSTNTGNAQLSATISNPSALNADNYTLSYDGTNYKITDSTTNTVMSTFASFPATPTAGVNIINGVTYTLSSGAMAAGDSFSISPTAGGAAGLSMVPSAQIASAAPIATTLGKANTGTGAITPGSVTKGYTPAAVSPPTTLTYTAGTNALTGFPVGANIVVTSNGVSTTYPAYVAGTPIPYTSGMSISFNNMTVGLSGAPGDGDTFNIGPNTNGTGDNRNVLLLTALQTQNTMNNGTATFQGAYAQLVNTIGNTTSQMTTIGTTENNLLTAAQKQQQSLSGVNIDEETVNLIQYQQAYQACGKVIQVASQNFATVLALNG